MKKHTLLLACAMRILLNLIALPSRGRCPAESNEGKILRTPACLLSLQISAHFTAVNVIDFVSSERV